MSSDKFGLELTEDTGNKDEKRLAKMFRKVKEDPAVPIGMGGWAALVGYGLYDIKNRKTSLSLYLISLRVRAQVFAIGCMTVAVGYNVAKKLMNKPKLSEAKTT